MCFAERICQVYNNIYTSHEKSDQIRPPYYFVYHVAFKGLSGSGKQYYYLPFPEYRVMPMLTEPVPPEYAFNKRGNASRPRNLKERIARDKDKAEKMKVQKIFFCGFERVIKLPFRLAAPTRTCNGPISSGASWPTTPSLTEWV